MHNIHIKKLFSVTGESIENKELIACKIAKKNLLFVQSITKLHALQGCVLAKEWCCTGMVKCSLTRQHVSLLPEGLCWAASAHLYVDLQQISGAV